jgi:hypothetical protein
MMIENNNKTDDSFGIQLGKTEVRKKVGPLLGIQNT